MFLRNTENKLMEIFTKNFYEALLTLFFHVQINGSHLNGDALITSERQPKSSDMSQEVTVYCPWITRLSSHQGALFQYWTYGQLKIYFLRLELIIAIALRTGFVGGGEGIGEVNLGGAWPQRYQSYFLTISPGDTYVVQVPIRYIL